MPSTGRAVKCVNSAQAMSPVSRSLSRPFVRTRVFISLSISFIVSRALCGNASRIRSSPDSSYKTDTDFGAEKVKSNPTRRLSLLRGVSCSPVPRIEVIDQGEDGASRPPRP